MGFSISKFVSNFDSFLIGPHWTQVTAEMKCEPTWVAQGSWQISDPRPYTCLATPCTSGLPTGPGVVTDDCIVSSPDGGSAFISTVGSEVGIEELF
jgi:hypothetical protein